MTGSSGEDRQSGFHSDRPEAVVFDDVHSTGHRRVRLIGAGLLILAAFILPQLDFFASDRQAMPVDFAFLSGGVLLLLWEAHAYFIKGAAPGQQGFVIVDATGIGGDALKTRERRITWARVRSVESDARAVIVRFDPKDLSSTDRLDRISEIRLSSPHATPAEIIDAIRRFWTPARDAPHSG
ncbi:MAG: hypothetical protein AB7F91_10535 [Parvularculaceae bacterium]